MATIIFSGGAGAILAQKFNALVDTGSVTSGIFFDMPGMVTNFKEEFPRIANRADFFPLHLDIKSAYTPTIERLYAGGENSKLLASHIERLTQVGLEKGMAASPAITHEILTTLNQKGMITQMIRSHLQGVRQGVDEVSYYFSSSGGGTGFGAYDVLMDALYQAYADMIGGTHMGHIVMVDGRSYATAEAAARRNAASCYLMAKANEENISRDGGKSLRRFHFIGVPEFGSDEDEQRERYIQSKMLAWFNKSHVTRINEKDINKRSDNPAGVVYFHTPITIGKPLAEEDVFATVATQTLNFVRQHYSPSTKAIEISFTAPTLEQEIFASELQTRINLYVAATRQPNAEHLVTQALAGLKELPAAQYQILVNNEPKNLSEMSVAELKVILKQIEVDLLKASHNDATEQVNARNINQLAGTLAQLVRGYFWRTIRHYKLPKTAQRAGLFDRRDPDLLVKGFVDQNLDNLLHLLLNAARYDSIKRSRIALQVLVVTIIRQQTSWFNENELISITEKGNSVAVTIDMSIEVAQMVAEGIRSGNYGNIRRLVKIEDAAVLQMLGITDIHELREALITATIDGMEPPIAPTTGERVIFMPDGNGALAGVKATLDAIKNVVPIPDIATFGFTGFQQFILTGELMAPLAVLSALTNNHVTKLDQIRCRYLPLD